VIDHGLVIAQGTGDELKDSIGGAMVEVLLDSPDQRDSAREALQGLSCEEYLEAEQPDQLVLAASDDGVAIVAAAARRLDEADISVKGLSLRRPTLDDVFLELTGAAPEPNGRGEGEGGRDDPNGSDGGGQGVSDGDRSRSASDGRSTEGELTGEASR